MENNQRNKERRLKILEKLEREKISLPELKEEEEKIREELFSRIEEGVEKKEKKKEEEKKKEISAQKNFFEDKEIIQKIHFLLNIAREKGILASINQIRKEKNPLLLDLYHDFLARKGFFKKFFFKSK